MSAVLIVPVTTTPAFAAGPPTALSVQSLGEWWAAPGMPGFVDDVHMGNGLPFAYMGLVSGGVTLRDGLLPAQAPWPGIDAIRAPLAWYDTTAVVVGEDGGWHGFGAALVQLKAVAPLRREGKPRAAFTWANGSSGVDRNGLLLQRGNADGWLRGGALEESRDATALLGRSGQHVWFMDLGRTRGAHTWSVQFSQRGMANTTRRVVDFSDLSPFLPPYAGFEEAGHSQSGGAGWSYDEGTLHARAALKRARDRRESYESAAFSDTLYLFSEREAQQNTIELEAEAGPPGHTRGVRLELTQAQVERFGDFFNSPEPTDAKQRTVWLATRATRPMLGASLELQLGAGYHSAAAARSSRFQVAPSAVMRWQEGDRTLRLHAGRFVSPVWSDLAFGVAPFVQDSWVGGADVSAGSRARQWVELGGLATSTGGRALLRREPIRELSLRFGWQPEPVRVQDAMVTLAAGVRRGPFGLDGSGFARVRPLGGQTSQPDPAVGARGALETGFRLFSGDLGIQLRLEAGWVGERDNESLPEYFVQPRPLAGYATFGGVLAVTLGDARLAFRAQNLEDEPHPQTWSDPSSDFPGTAAVGSGRQYRLELAWPFFN
ncbi:MAG: hypothetical protein ABL977_07625 [Candidatus Eisenbacteria bacterium]